MSKGDECCVKARNILNRYNFWFFGPSVDDNINEAINMYKKAITFYILDTLFEKAAEIHIEIAKLYLRLSRKNTYMSADNYLQAAKLYKSTNIDLMVEYIKKSNELVLESGKFDFIARNEELLGETLESNNNIDAAIVAYNNAHKYYELTNLKISGMKCLQKVAFLNIKINNVEYAIELFEKIANHYENTDLSKYKYPQFVMYSLICRLYVEDNFGIKTKMDTFNNMFSKSNEYKFVNSILIAYENNDKDKFIKHLYEFGPFESWCEELLFKIRDKIDFDINEDEVDLT